MQELERLEGLILNFAVSKHLQIHLAPQHDKSASLQSLIQKAEFHLANKEFGRSICAYTNSAYYFKSWQYEVPDRLTRAYFFGVIETQIALCSLLLGNAKEALRHANKCISYDTSCQLVHIWRAFAYRRLGLYARAVKSLSIRTQLFMVQALAEMFGYTYRLVTLHSWNSYEEDVLITYWEQLLHVVNNLTDDYKMDHYKETPHMSEDALNDELSLRFLSTHPAFHDTVLADTCSMRILPESFRGALETQDLNFFHHVVGFRETSVAEGYFTNLPKASKELIRKLGRVKDFRIKPHVVEKVKSVCRLSEMLNCTSYEHKLHPGFGLHERMLLCAVLVYNREFEEAQQEFRCLKADILLFIYLARKVELRCQPSPMKQLAVVRRALHALKVRLEREEVTDRSVGNLMHWLTNCSVKWTANSLSRSVSKEKVKTSKNRKASRGILPSRGRAKKSRGGADWTLTHSSPRKLRFHRSGASI